MEKITPRDTMKKEHIELVKQIIKTHGEVWVDPKSDCGLRWSKGKVKGWVKIKADTLQLKGQTHD